MKKVLKVIGGLVLLIGVILIGYTVFSRVYYKRSLRASLAEIYLHLTVKHLSAEEMEERLAERKKEKEEEYFFPKGTRIEGGVTVENFSNMKVLRMNEEGKGKHILYLHGGSYLHDPDPHHFKFLDKLIKMTDARVTFPVYPKAPRHDFSETYHLLMKLYEERLKTSEEGVILMGDSAGGGLALGFAEYLMKEGKKTPSGVIALSPWLDLTMENPEIKEYEKVDPWLRGASSGPIARAWANGTDLKDYRLSPTFGALTGLKKVAIFVGTREILYPDIMKFADKLKEKNIELKLFVGQGMNHVYPLFPIPEAKEALGYVSEVMETMD